MKSPVAYIVHVYKIYLLTLAALCVLAVPVFALRMTEMPEEIQTKIKDPRDRAISLKLPLLQPNFHWTFMSRDDFLSGKLLLRIIQEEEISEIIIFENGQFTEGWEAMSLPPAPERGEIYFGFISTVKYMTAPDDKLEIELTVKKDLQGIGAMQAGMLPAGIYKSKGTYSGLIDEYDTSAIEARLTEQSRLSADEQETLLNRLCSMYENKAFLESWEDQWPLKITSQTGWLPEEQAKAVTAMVENLDQPAGGDFEEESPTTSADSVISDEQPSRVYLLCWIAVPVIGLFVAVIVLRFLNKP
jgi:hypothetical protein